MMPKTRFSMQRGRRMDGRGYLRPLEYQMLLKCLQLADASHPDDNIRFFLLYLTKETKRVCH